MRRSSLSLLAALGLVSATAGAQLPAGWTALKDVPIDKNGCASCPVIVPTQQVRYRAFGVASGTPYAVSLSGRIDVKCADGTTYNVALRSATRAGIFETFPNTCVNLDAKELEVTITSVNLSPPDAERSVVLTVYGRMR